MKYVYLLILFRLGLTQADCERLPVIENTNNNATTSAPYASGTIIKFECDLGFNPTGSSKFYICEGNMWTNGNLKCEQIYCRHVEPPEDGRIVNTPTNEIGSSINFECNEGYDMEGQKNMLCRTDGEWLPKQPPICRIKSCGDFGSIQYATTFQDSSDSVRDGYGSVVEVTCKSGYIINGPPRVMCQADGNWGEKPTCVVTTCPHYPGLNSSCIQHTQITGAFLFMLCKEDVPVTKTGPDVIECIDGQWEKTDQVMACYCNCKVIADLTLVSLNNVNAGYLNHTRTLDWSCKRGSTKTVTNPLVCNDGNTLQPVCKSNKPPTKSTPSPVTDKDEKTVNPPPTTKAPETDSTPETDSLPVGGIVGGVVGAIAVIAFVVLGVYWWKTKRKNNPGNEKPNKSTVNEAGVESEKEKINLGDGTNGDAV